MPETKLTRPAIVAAAIELADTDGLDCVTFRRLADRMGTGVMSLYRHVANKDMLLTEMTDEVARRNMYPSAVEQDWTWRDRVRIAGEVDWELYRRHPWVLFTFAIPRYNFGPAGQECLAWLVEGFRELEVSTREATRMALTVWCYIAGAALPLVAAGPPEQDREPPRSGLRALLDGEPLHPAPQPLSDLFGSGRADELLDQERLLHIGLTALCDGFAARD